MGMGEGAIRVIFGKVSLQVVSSVRSEWECSVL